ncbi:MAG: hypothetical protein AB7E95_05690 [Kiritimatiellales bacterium]
MIDLSTGLYLENQGFWLPWGITNDEAWQIGKPLPWNLPEDRSRMKWENVIVLNGLECTAQTYFPNEQSPLLQINLLDAHYEEHPPHVWLETLQKHCRQVFGLEIGLRTWQQGNIHLKIWHDDRFVEAFWLELRNTAGQKS